MNKRVRTVILKRIHGGKQVCLYDRKDKAHKLHIKLSYILKGVPVGALIHKNDLEVVMKLVDASDEDLEIMVRRYQLLKKRRKDVWAVNRVVVPRKLSLLGNKEVA